MAPKNLSCKIVLLGEGNVGKTSLRRRYLGEGFSQNYAMTIGADFAAKRIRIGNWNITSNIWDLAGQTKFKAMRESYYQGATGALLVFDITEKSSFEAINKWIEELSLNIEGLKVPIVLIGNKSDLRDKAPDPISSDMADKFAKNHEDIICYVESSAKTGENVETAFETLINLIFDKYINNK